MSRFENNTRTEKENTFSEELGNMKHGLSPLEQFQNFTMFTPRQDITRFLAKYELYKMIQDVHGIIVEGGCLTGGGVLGWHHFTSIHEPFNHVRKVIGFDTFEGFPELTANEVKHSPEAHKGGLAIDSEKLIMESSRIHDMNRPIGHIPKVELIRGDACETMPKFAAKRPQPIALLYLDFDIYEPTKVALEHLYPLMPKGAVIGFDECHEKWGECKAVMEFMQTHKLELKRFPWASTISYAVV